MLLVFLIRVPRLTFAHTTAISATCSGVSVVSGCDGKISLARHPNQNPPELTEPQLMVWTDATRRMNNDRYIHIATMVWLLDKIRFTNSENLDNFMLSLFLSPDNSVAHIHTLVADETASPAINFLTAYWDLLQKLHKVFAWLIRMERQMSAAPYRLATQYHTAELNQFLRGYLLLVASVSSRSSMLKAFSWVIAGAMWSFSFTFNVRGAGKIVLRRRAAMRLLPSEITPS